MADVIVGTDSYISEADATTYVVDTLLSTDTKRIAWAHLSSADKCAQLRQALPYIENLRFPGSPLVIGQILAFPRITDSTYYRARTLNNTIVRGFTIEVPADIKHAQVDIALDLLSLTTSVEIANRLALQQQGVTSITEGKASETYSGMRSLSHLAFSPNATQKLSKYTGGGFRFA